MIGRTMRFGRRLLAGGCALALVAGMAAAQTGPQTEAATDVEGLVVKAPTVPIPKVGDGAPLYTAEELKAMAEQSSEARRELQRRGIRCGANKFWGMFYEVMEERSRRLAVLANRAHEATLYSEEVRRAAAKGEATQEQVEAAELARQKAVNLVINLPPATSGDSAYGPRLMAVSRSPRNVNTLGAAGAITAPLDNLLWDLQGGFGRIVPKSVRDLALVDTAADFTEDFKDLVVVGAVYNTRNRQVTFPPLTFTVVDVNGEPLKTVVAVTEKQARLKSGERRAFTYEIRDAPQMAAGVNVTLGGDRALMIDRASLPEAC